MSTHSHSHTSSSGSCSPSPPPSPPVDFLPASQSPPAKSSITHIASLIKSGKAKKIVVLTGAGISTSAGIPDFRSPETGLYHNLQALNLPFPEAVFELGYFGRNPVPFWTLAKELYPGKHFPTSAHYFFPLLAQHDVLLRVFSQNIDTLETLAGLPRDKIVEAHGSFATSRCLECRTEASRDYVLRSGVRRGEVVRCDASKGKGKCGGLVKPDIVFFGEGLPKRFFDRLRDLEECDLLIVIGTSLQVQPFASLVDRVGDDVPRLLINREAVGPFERIPSSRSSGLGTSLAEILRGAARGTKGKGRDYFWQGDADDGVRRLADELGWGEELQRMVAEGRKALQALWKGGAPVTTEKVEQERPAEARVKTEKVEDEVPPAVSRKDDDDIDALQQAIDKHLRV